MGEAQVPQPTHRQTSGPESLPAPARCEDAQAFPVREAGIGADKFRNFRRDMGDGGSDAQNVATALRGSMTFGGCPARRDMLAANLPSAGGSAADEVLRV